MHENAKKANDGILQEVANCKETGQYPCKEMPANGITFAMSVRVKKDEYDAWFHKEGTGRRSTVSSDTPPRGKLRYDQEH